MRNRIAATAVLAGVIMAGAAGGARAQQPTSAAPQVTTASGWSFDVTPYLWMPSINASLNFNLPPALGGTVSANPSVNFGDLVSHLNIGFMGAADVRYDRFSLLTDILWLNAGGISGQFKSINFPNHPAIPITSGVNTSESLRLNAEIWTLAGGYTLFQGDWGNLDAFAGFRLFATSTRINYSLGISIAGPRGNGATFGGVGGVSSVENIWNGIAGFRGQYNMGTSGLYIPYYFDIGAGGSQLTWQIATGVGYHFSMADVSLTYRYMSFLQDSSNQQQHLWFQGPMIAATFRF